MLGPDKAATDGPQIDVLYSLTQTYADLMYLLPSDDKRHPHNWSGPF